MEEKRQELLESIYRDGVENDGSQSDRSKKMLNITPDTGEFLWVLVRATCAKTVLELGTSNGYSGIWLADALEEDGGRLITVDSNGDKLELARGNFAEARITGTIETLHSDALDVLRELGDGDIDLLFLDAHRGSYCKWWSELYRVLRTGGLIVVDNSISHQAELESFVDLVSATPACQTSLVPVGKGELLIYKG